jgi:hypothetical protein
VTAAVDQRQATAGALLRRQVLLTAATLGVAVIGLALLRFDLLAPGSTRYVPEGTGAALHMRAVSDGHSAMAVRLAIAELVLCGAVALVAVGHAARVIAFVLQKESSR